MIQGVNLGIVEITNEQDFTDAVAVGSNTVRIPIRWDGVYDNYCTDSRDDSQPKKLKPEYITMMQGMSNLAERHDLDVQLGMDSNNLQGLRGAGYYDLWTPELAGKLPDQFIRVGCFFVRMFKPTRVEPIVEPTGPNVTQLKRWDYQERFMRAIMDRTPFDGKFSIGGDPAYMPAYFGNVFRPEWASPENDFFGRIELTCNFGDELCRNVPMFNDRLQTVLRVRDRLKLDVTVNQLWTDANVDPDGVALERSIRALRSNGVGVMAWTACGKFPDGPVLSHLEHPNDPRSAHVRNEARWAAVARAFA